MARFKHGAVGVLRCTRKSIERLWCLPANHGLSIPRWHRCTCGWVTRPWDRLAIHRSRHASHRNSSWHRAARRHSPGWHRPDRHSCSRRNRSPRSAITWIIRWVSRIRWVPRLRCAGLRARASQCMPHHSQGDTNRCFLETSFQNAAFRWSAAGIFTRVQHRCRPQEINKVVRGNPTKRCSKSEASLASL